MNRIEKLIKEKCPNGVVFRSIGDCCNFQNGYAFKSNLFKPSGSILLRITNINGKEIDLTDVKYIDINDYKTNLQPFTVKYDEIVIAMSGATTGKIGINKTKTPLYLNQRVGKITPKDSRLNNHFLYHILLSKTEYFYKLAGGGAQPNLSTDAIKNTLIPVPPIEVQEEIVRILDQFGKLEAELEAELEARKSQYEYYRKSLLNTGEELIKLKDIAHYSTDRINYTELNEDNYVGVDNLLQNKKGKTKSSHVPTTGTSTKFEIDDILIGNIRPYLRKIWIADCMGGTNGDVLDIRINNSKLVNPKFIYYVLSSENFFEYNNSNSKGAKMPRGDKQAIMNYEFKIPTLEKQNCIVQILDKFDSLVNDIKEGIPAEIEARRKQYEFYRNRLLNFEEVSYE